MGKDQDWRNLGEQILDSVADALNSGDFRELNNLVSGTVNDVVQEAKKQAEAERAVREDAIRQYREHNEANYEKWREQQQELLRRQQERREEWRKMRDAQMARRSSEQAARREAEQNNGDASREEAQSKRPPKPVKAKFHATGSVANVLNTVFGALGIGVGVSFFIVGSLLLTGGFSIAPLFFNLGLFGSLISLGLLIKGGKQRGLLKRAQRYIQICGSRMYANLDELALQTGQSVRAVKKDIKKMLRKGMFPEGHLDRSETCFMLSDEIYRQYTETAQAYKMRDEMEADRTRQSASAAQDSQTAEAPIEQLSELDAMMLEGNEYLRKLHELNDAIPGEEISSQLTQLESLLKQIFERVKVHPEQMNRMHKLMDYYLPTTVKLVEAYVRFEQVETPGKDIQGAKAEILKTLGIINEAFTELLNNLFQDEVFDATTDAQVLQTMLSREGLRREMDTSDSGFGFGVSEQSYEEGSLQAADADEDGEDGEDEESPFQFNLEPEQPEVLGNLKAPWES